MKGYKTQYLTNCFMYIPCLLLVAAAVLAPLPAGAQELKLHPLANYMVKYKSEGNATGEKIQYSQDYGRKICLKESLQITMPEIGSVKRNEKMVSWIENGERWIVVVNLDDNTGTKFKDPTFAKVSESIKGKDPKDFNQQQLMSMGGMVKGHKTVSGEQCSMWSFPQGIEMCITEDFIMLETIANVQDLTVNETAVEVKRNTSEPAGLCDLTGVNITERDINQMMQQQAPQQQQQPAQ